MPQGEFGEHGLADGARLDAPVVRDPRDDDEPPPVALVGRRLAQNRQPFAGWANFRIARDLEAEVKELRDTPGRDILVVNSASVIQALPRADLIDDLRFVVVPMLLGAGLRLFEEGIPASAWALAQSTVLTDGAIGLHYERVRPALPAESSSPIRWSTY
ncbi:dihydrofolate reductase family protein [Streptomyces sp. Ncost-T10-10d]|uniref:dihydrofolate reductase family protein n=1 Tax=Streptomyces sp. Ncost-T10-10d TaxID=1839774 RepID=UPI001C4029D1